MTVTSVLWQLPPSSSCTHSFEINSDWQHVYHLADSFFNRTFLWAHRYIDLHSRGSALEEAFINFVFCASDLEIARFPFFCFGGAGCFPLFVPPIAVILVVFVQLYSFVHNVTGSCCGLLLFGCICCCCSYCCCCYTSVTIKFQTDPPWK